MSYASLVNSVVIPQTERLNDRQVANNGGGFSYALDIWAQLDRFLVLGSDQPTYYASARELTRENAKSVEACWKADHVRTANKIIEISVAGRAPKNSAAIFALALGTLSEDQAVRRSALDAVASVCRTASHLFEFSALLDALGRGWGRAVSRAISNWYETKSPEKLAYQMTKYRSRNGYTHERLIQRTHPKAADGNAERVALYRWACGGNMEGHMLPELVRGQLQAMATEKASELIPLIEKHNLTWEQIPTWALSDAKIWEALLPNLGMTALLRNLGTLTDLGVIKALGGATSDVVTKLSDPDEIKRSKLHPYSILNALAVYRSGKSVKGKRSWRPVSTVSDALDDAFYLAFSNVEPTGKRHMLAIDVSGSMGTQLIGGVLPAREAAGAMAMATAKAEKQHHFVGFGDRIFDLDLSAKMRLSDVCSKIHKFDFGATDCAAPMIHALKHGLEVDAFVVYTDNETNQNSMHPSVALQRYRKETGIAAKLIVAAMTSNNFSIADPLDGGMLDVVGFDSDAVSLIGDFVRG